LVAVELLEVAGEVDRAHRLVEDDKPTRAEHPAQRRQRVEVDRDVELLLTQRPGRDPTGLDALEDVPLPHATEEAEDHLAHRHAHLDLDHADALHRTLHGDELRAGALLRAHRGVPGAAIPDDAGDVGEGLGVVQHRRALPHALFDGARRLGPRLAPLAHDRVHQRRTFAADVRAATGADPDVAAHPAAEHVVAEQAELVGLIHGLAEALDRQLVLAPHVVVAVGRFERVATDHDPFQDQMRVALDQPPILEDVGLPLVAVGDDVLWPRLGAPAALPLDPGREARATATTHVGDLDLVDDLLRRHVEDRLDPRLVAAAGDVVFDRLRVDDPPVGHQDAALPGKERMLVQRWDAFERLVGADAERPLGLDDPALHGIDQLRHLVGRDLLVDDRRRARCLHLNVGLGPAPAGAANPPYLGRDSRLLQREPEVIHRLTGTLGDAALANAHAHDPAVARGALRPAPF